MPSADDLILRRATGEDAESLWLWRNDPAARAMSPTPDPVPWEGHVAWLSRRLADPRCRLLIGESAGRPVGMVRFDADETGQARISIAVDPEARGGGIGGRLLQLACDEVIRDQFCDVLVADVKATNEASLRIFERAGFVEAESAGGWRRLTRNHAGQHKAAARGRVGEQ